MDINIDRRRFEQWLSGQRGIVGTACDRNDCPLARWLRDEGVRVSYVLEYDVGVETGGEIARYRLPEWARWFVTLVDGSSTSSITAGRALRLLARASELSSRYGSAPTGMLLLPMEML